MKRVRIFSVFLLFCFLPKTHGLTVWASPEQHGNRTEVPQGDMRGTDRAGSGTAPGGGTGQGGSGFGDSTGAVPLGGNVGGSVGGNVPAKIDEKTNRVRSFKSPGPGWQPAPPVMMPQMGPPEWIRSRVTSMESPGDDYEMEIIFMPRTGPPTWVPKGSQGLNQPPATTNPMFPSTMPGSVSGDGQAARGSFTEVSGLEVETPAIDYRTGSEDGNVRKIPGLKKPKNVEMKRSIVDKTPQPPIDEKTNRVQSFESPGPGWQMAPPLAMPQYGPPEWIRSRVTSMESPGDDYEMEIIFMPRTGPPTWVPKGSQNLAPSQTNPTPLPPPPAERSQGK